MLPKCVGLPRIRPSHSASSSSVAYGAPSAGTGSINGSVFAVTFGTRRSIASQSVTLSTPRAMRVANDAVLPLEVSKTIKTRVFMAAGTRKRWCRFRTGATGGNLPAIERVRRRLRG